jgi:hypothetical protein
MRIAYDDDPMQILAKHNTDKSVHHHISIIGHITEEELKRQLTEVDQYNGFFNRLLPVYVRRSKVLPFPPDRDRNVENWLVLRLQKALAHASTTAELAWAEDAKPLWAEQYEHLTGGRYGLYGALTRRAAPQVIRIAMIYALLDGETQFIHKHHLEAALEVWRYVEGSIRYVFGDVSLFALDNKLLAIIRNAGSTGIAKSAIHKAFGGNKDAREINASLSSLEQQGKIRHEDVPSDGKGKSTTVWYAV